MSWSKHEIPADKSSRYEDLLVLIIMFQVSALIILAEAADVHRHIQWVWVVTLFVYCTIISLATGLAPWLPNWAPSEAFTLIFFSMPPRSHFASAHATMAIFLIKAGVSMAQGNDFMFLRCHYQYYTDQLDAAFLKISGSEEDEFHFEDFRGVCSELGIAQSHISAGFHAMDVDHSGRVSLEEFRSALKDTFMDMPGASHAALLTKYCSDSIKNAAGYRSLDSMLGLVVNQFRRFALDDFGVRIYACLRKFEGMDKFWASLNIRRQALLFASIMQISLRSLEEKDAKKVELYMIDLGERHKMYNVRAGHLCAFHLSLLETLAGKNADHEREGELAWSLVFRFFLARPFLKGLFAELPAYRKAQVLSSAKSFLLRAQEPDFVPALCEKLQQLPTRLSWDFDQEDETKHIEDFIALLLQSVEHLHCGRRHAAREAVRGILRRHEKFSMRHVLGFQHAFASTMAELEPFSHEADTRWALFCQGEVLDVMLMAPFADRVDRIEQWAQEQQSRQVNFLAWQRLMQQAKVPETLVDNGFQRLRHDSGREDVYYDEVVAIFCQESMQHPFWSFEKLMANYCGTKLDEWN